MEDGELMFGVIESASELWIRGGGMDLGTELKYECGDHNWTVGCKCGPWDGNGETMVACDIQALFWMPDSETALLLHGEAFGRLKVFLKELSMAYWQWSECSGVGSPLDPKA
ncbi:hypothetical protein F0562_005376 [Nyssa sinensis]|uniref:Uncharacterized protein n=1 Tax=Nyssa sinensis TaxID=561372 RepID=A0A5J5AJ78_9ASTE|nr:hypothetical protein F0562_005376 [Nyssa sinensis]